MTISAPRWDMTTVYPALDSKEFKSAVADYKKQVAALDRFFTAKVSQATAKTPAKKLAELVGAMVDRLNRVETLSATIHPYLYAFVTTNSRDAVAAKAMSEFEQASLPMNKLEVRFKAWLGRVAPKLPQATKLHKSARAHAFFLKEAARQSKYLMSEAEESLAAEMTLSGGNAFDKLQGTFSSQLSAEIELDGKVQKLPLTTIIYLRSHADEPTRRRGYETENTIYEGTKQVFAACLNGVKGETLTLAKRRGRKDAIELSLVASRIDRKTLDAMLGAMHDSFPMFRKYFGAKAKKLGKERLPWWDIYAPIGKANQQYSFEDARDFILENFGKFSPDLRLFAKRAFDSRWIDAEQRDGKRAGAYCMEVQGPKESRVFSNFDGTFDAVGTLSHELGHAFHNECAYQAGKTVLQQLTPMTLAETASIMCETIVSEAVLAGTKDPEVVLGTLENQIQGAAAVVVDIYSRYLFEKEVFERRAQAELSADDFNDAMERAQKATYGDGLDARYLQKFMWTWKPHYYSPNLPFYNYPYAFGLLFGKGLYAIYQQRGPAFVQDYKNLLASTGEAQAATLAKRFGIDIRTPKFWRDSLAMVGKQIDRYVSL
jgi:pepF/M3 family oligoendopeptidase